MSKDGFIPVLVTDGSEILRARSGDAAEPARCFLDLIPIWASLGHIEEKTERQRAFFSEAVS
jgi:hypothetical protein